jgi:hypothetical protein
VSVSLSLEMIKTLFSLHFYNVQKVALKTVKLSVTSHFYNFGYSAYSGNRLFICGFVVLYPKGIKEMRQTGQHLEGWA